MRVWLEGAAGEFRGRLASVDTSGSQPGGELTVAVTSTPEDMLEAVRAWLDDFSQGAPAPHDSGT